MATNPNKVGSLAYSVWEKNNALKKTTPVSSTWWAIATASAIQANTAQGTQPTVAQIAAGNGAGWAYGTKTPAQIQAEYNAKTNTTATPVTTTPTSTITPSKSTALSGYKFGSDAMVANAKDNTYLSTRNTAYANDFSTKWLKDYQSVYNELNKNVNFQSATQQDKDNTTKSIWDQMQKTVVQPKPATSNTWSANWRESGQPYSTTETKVGDETYSAVDFDKRIKQVDDYLATPGLSETERRAAEVAREEQIRLKNQQAQSESNFNADTKFVKDSNQWTLDDNQRAYDEQARDLNLKLEQAKLTTDRQIEDVRKMTDRNIALQEKSAALSWLNRGAWFTQGMNNIKKDALDTINRLQADLENYNASVWLAKSSAYQTYTDNKNRAIEKFTNQYKDLLNNTNTDLQKAMWKFPDFSDEKLKKQLAIIKEGYYAKSQAIFGTWVDQMNSIHQDARAESDQIMKLEQFANQQEDRIVTQWAGKDGEGYLTLTQDQLKWLVDSGQIKQSTAMATFNQMKAKAQNTINALAVNKVATPEESKAVIDAINSGMSAQDAIAKVVASNPARFVQITNTQDWQKLNDWRLYNQRTGEIKNIDWTTSTSGGYQWPVIPPVQQQVVENNIQQVQSISDGTVWGQCGAFVNNYTQSLWLGKLFQDPITQKSGLSNSTTPKVWSIFITDSEKFPQYWHVGIVTKVNADGSFETKESNKAGEWQVFSRTMQPWQAKYGFFDPTLWKQPSANWWFSDEVMNTAKAIMNWTSTLKLSDLPTKERALVSQAVNTLKDQAKTSWDVVWLMRASAWGTAPSAEERKAISKAYWTLSQIDTLANKLWLKNAEIKDANTWDKIDVSPITWWIREKNPRDTDAQEIKQILTSTIPWLARGIYGEVWVLTDQDVELYKQTIPNLRQTDAVKKAVIWLTYRTIRNALKSNMEVLAGSSVDVSWLADQYKAIDDKIMQIEKELWVWQSQSNNNAPSNTNSKGRGL